MIIDHLNMTSVVDHERKALKSDKKSPNTNRPFFCVAISRVCDISNRASIRIHAFPHGFTIR